MVTLTHTLDQNITLTPPSITPLFPLAHPLLGCIYHFVDICCFHSNDIRFGLGCRVRVPSGWLWWLQMPRTIKWLDITGIRLSLLTVYSTYSL